MENILSRSFHFLEHSDSIGTSNTNSDKHKSIQLNRILCDDAHILTWTEKKMMNMNIMNHLKNFINQIHIILKFHLKEQISHCLKQIA